LSHISRTKNGIDKNPISRAYYLKKIAEGKTKKEAITCLQRRLCDVIFAVMRDKAEYDFLKIKSIEKSCDILETSIA